MPETKWNGWRTVCRDGRYRTEKQIVTDPHRDTVLQRVQFIAQQAHFPISTFMSCSRRTWETRAAAIPHGRANSRARHCCLLSGKETHWRWPAPLRGRSGLSVTSALSIGMELPRLKGVRRMKNGAKSEVNGFVYFAVGSRLSAACSSAMIRTLFPGPYCSLRISFLYRPPWRRLSSVPF